MLHATLYPVVSGLGSEIDISVPDNLRIGLPHDG
jgi:hypothetical protein